MTSAPLIISVSGLRGVVGASLTPEIAMRYAAALALELPPGPIVVARDGRTTGTMIGDAVRSALTALGRDTLDGGVAATPTVGVLVRNHAAAGGIQISASHNPPQYNGLKLFNNAGRVIPAEDGGRVLERYRRFSQEPLPWVTADQVGAVIAIEDVTQDHLDKVAALVDVDRIRGCKFSVLLDANHGSGSCLGRPLLEHLGCRVTILGGTPDGRFSHVPEPTAENLQGVLRQVVQSGANVGFCQDPDADRLAIVDEQGHYLGEELTLALCADHLLRTRRVSGPVVTNCSTSRMTEDLAKRYEVPFYRSAVGEANVVDMMLAKQAVLGGEGNGGVIEPRVGLVRDSFVGMAMVLDALAARQKPISALAAELPQYAICKTQITLTDSSAKGSLEPLAARFPEAVVSRLDGLRLDLPDGSWLLVRASNTEPIVRAVAEPRSAERARELCAAAATALA